MQTSTVPHAATVSGSSSRLSEIVTALQYAIKYEGKEGWCNSRGRASSFAEAMVEPVPPTLPDTVSELHQVL